MESVLVGGGGFGQHKQERSRLSRKRAGIKQTKALRRPHLVAFHRREERRVQQFKQDNTKRVHVRFGVVFPPCHLLWGHVQCRAHPLSVGSQGAALSQTGTLAVLCR